MNKIIKIPEEIINDILAGELTRNQIILILLLCSKNETYLSECIKKIYYYDNKKLNKDLTFIKNKYNSIFNDFNNYENNIVKDIKNADYLKEDEKIKYIKEGYKTFTYYKVKYETIKNIMELCNHKSLNLNLYDLKVLIYVLKLYRIDYIRDHTLYLKNMIKEIYNKKYRYRYKIYLMKSLNKLINFKYEDGSSLIKSYEIKENYIIIKLDKIHKKKQILI